MTESLWHLVTYTWGTLCLIAVALREGDPGYVDGTSPSILGVPGLRCAHSVCCQWTRKKGTVAEAVTTWTPPSGTPSSRLHLVHHLNPTSGPPTWPLPLIHHLAPYIWSTTPTSGPPPKFLHLFNHLTPCSWVHHQNPYSGPAEIPLLLVKHLNYSLSVHGHVLLPW